MVSKSQEDSGGKPPPESDDGDGRTEAVPEVTETVEEETRPLERWEEEDEEIDWERLDRAAIEGESNVASSQTQEQGRERTAGGGDPVGGSTRASRGYRRGPAFGNRGR